MSYDRDLAARVRASVARRRGITEQPMFGGLSFLARGKMFCGVARNDLVVRVGPDDYADALARPHARPMDFTGKPMRGMVYVAPEGVRTERQLRAWIERGLAFARNQA